jgi:hypothetical protein
MPTTIAAAMMRKRMMFGQITEITPRSYIASGPIAGCSRSVTSLGPLTVRLGGYSVLDLAPDRREARRDADVVADRHLRSAQRVCGSRRYVTCMDGTRRVTVRLS